ncbi:uncharacterized protein LOC135850034 isoform X2 [Planococcus citri]
MPTEGMRKAIHEAQVGDDLYAEDPTVNALEARCAKLTGKEAGLYVPSGTMANLISIMVHCNERASEVIAGQSSHMNCFEQRGSIQFGGISVREIREKEDGTFDLDELNSLVRKMDPLMEPTTKVVNVENTHMVLGGKVLPLEWIDKLIEFAKSKNLKTHLDGCRVFNTAVKLNVSVSRITANFDSITISFGKGLGAPIGAMVIGSSDFIKKARRVRKALGGGCSQIGFMAAAAMYALDNLDHLQDDHEHTQMIAQAIREAGNPYITVPKAENIHSNILMISIDTSKLTPKKFIGRLNKFSIQDEDPVMIKALPVGDRTVRLVLCINNSKSDVEAAIIKIKKVIDEFR